MDSVYTIALADDKYLVVETTSKSKSGSWSEPDVGPDSIHYVPDSQTMDEIVEWAKTLDCEWVRRYPPAYVVSKLSAAENAMRDQLVDCMAIHGLENVRLYGMPDELTPQMYVDYRREISARKNRCFNCLKKGHYLGNCPVPRILPMDHSPFSPRLANYATLTENYWRLNERAKGNCDLCLNSGLVVSGVCSDEGREDDVYVSCYSCFTLEDRNRYGCSVYGSDLVWEI